MKAVVSGTGRVTIPRLLRDRLGIVAGTVLEFHEEDGRLIAVEERSGDVFSRWRGKGRLPNGMTVDEYLGIVRGVGQ